MRPRKSRGGEGGSLEVRFITAAPPCQRPTAARLLGYRLGRQGGGDVGVTPESGIRSGESSELGWIETAPVLTTPSRPLPVSRAVRTRGISSCRWHGGPDRSGSARSRARSEPAQTNLMAGVVPRLASVTGCEMLSDFPIRRVDHLFGVSGDANTDPMIAGRLQPQHNSHHTSRTHHRSCPCAEDIARQGCAGSGDGGWCSGFITPSARPTLPAPKARAGMLVQIGTTPP